MIIPKKNALNQRTFHNLQPHLACLHTKMSKLIRHTTCESLVYIKRFRHEWSSIKKELNKLAVTSAMYIEMCVLIRQTEFRNFCKVCLTRAYIWSIFWV